jgi:Tfp pilus assembly protein PilN
MLAYLKYVPAVMLLAQIPGVTSSSNDWSPTNVALILWVLGQVAVVVINAIRGNPQIQQQNQQINNLSQQLSNHDSQLTNLASQMMPPEAQAQVIQTLVQVAGKAAVPTSLAAPVAARPQQAQPQAAAVKT